MFYWNPIHLVDGEARWFLTFLFVLTVAALATHAWRWLAHRLLKQFQEHKQPIKEAAVAASISPVAFYIWFITGIKCLDLISDQFFSESLTSELNLFYKVSAVLVIAWFLVRLKHNFADVLLQKSHAREIVLEPGKVAVISKMISAFIFILIVLLLMEATGLSINALIAFGGVSGLAIAFASQELIANFFGGIMLHVVEPFAVGDTISVPNSTIEGKVEEIGWYETRVRSTDKQPIYIPNSLFSKSYVVNSTRRSHRRLDEKISLRHEDLAKTAPILVDIRRYLVGLADIDSTDKIFVNIEEIATYSVDISIRALSYRVDELEFRDFRDVVLIKTAEIVASHGAQIAIPLEEIRSQEKEYGTSHTVAV